MKLTVYIDILIFINTIINYFLLKISGVILCIPTDTKKLIFSSLIGALFSINLLFDISSFVSIFIKMLCILLCRYTAFGFVSRKYYLKSVMVFLTVNCIFTGLLDLFLDKTDFVYINNLFYYININPVLLVISVTAVYIFISVFDLIYDFKNRKNSFEFDLTLDGKTVKLTGFYDTGFKVKDLLNGRAVILRSLPQVENNLDEILKEKLKKFLLGDITIPGITPIFYSDISSKGMLPAVKPDRLMYKNKEIKNTVVAFTDKDFGQDVRLIFGKEIYNMTGE